MPVWGHEEKGQVDDNSDRTMKDAERDQNKNKVVD